MRKLSLIIGLASLCVSVFAQPKSSLPKPNSSSPLKYVNPFIGTGGHGHTYPGATAPFGMVQLSPDSRLSMLDWDGCSGYHYADSIIYGFSHTHLSGTGVADYCDILVMPFIGPVVLDPSKNGSSFQKSTEKAEAGYYSVVLDRNNIKCEMTATERVGVHRYTFPKNEEKGEIMVDLRHRDEVLSSGISLVNDHEIAGYRISKSWAKEQHVYFVMRFSRPFANSVLLDMNKTPREANPTIDSKSIVGLLDFYNDNTPLVITVGISGTSIEGARKNLDAECNHFDFEQVKKETQEKWEQQLSKIQVEGGSDAQKTIFYTALYHTSVVPNLWSDVDGAYRGRDNKVHTASGETYTVFSLWDTYRACNPLYTILEPRRTNQFIQTFLRQYQESGLLPVWELAANETDCMIGNHSIPVIADAWAKGIRGYDGELALKAMMANANSDRYGLRWYREMGFVPSNREAESVSKTLEYAFDDWCISQMAARLDKPDIASEFARRAQYYKNLYDPSTGFFRARRGASWHSPFDPFEVNFNYTEANAWQYRFAAPQDITGLMLLLGGKERFAQQLDALFTAQTKTTGRDQADITGLIGQYVHGNEPSHHMAYLYNYVGQPWKTQQRVRQIMDSMYSDQPDGLSGNEDCGQMSAWLVLSAMGIYPVVPGNPQYAIGTPWFERMVLTLENGSQLDIRAPKVSAKNCYVKGVRLNDQAWSKSWISHDQLVQGGTLEFDMTNNPAQWGSAESDCPVQFIQDRPIISSPFVKTGSTVFKDRTEVELGCADPDAKIRYMFADISGKVQWRDYQNPVKVDRSQRMFIHAEKGNDKSNAVLVEFHRIRSDLKVLNYKHPYSPQYTAGGNDGLVDGVRGGEDFRTGGWQGFEGENLDMVIDLGRQQKVSRVSANFLQDENSWIFFPTALQVEVSEDGKSFTPAGEQRCDISPSALGTLQKELSVTLAGNTRARYVRIVGKSLGKCPATHKGAGYACWLFTDEVTVEN
ncbi:MAG TPA: glycosyl hydrolase family 92 [Saprospirales bacterium]|nr:glycosyl hydrolase family 92 [Saprospirales bacterium]